VLLVSPAPPFELNYTRPIRVKPKHTHTQNTLEPLHTRETLTLARKHTSPHAPPYSPFHIDRPLPPLAGKTSNFSLSCGALCLIRLWRVAVKRTGGSPVVGEVRVSREVDGSVVMKQI
jgi:hypothetical protein